MRLIHARIDAASRRYTRQCFTTDDLTRIRSLRRIVPPVLQSVLDVGCYDGQFSRKLFPQTGVFLCGLELSLDAARNAATTLTAVIRCDIEESFPLLDNSFECVLATEIIEHVYDPDYLLAEIGRVLVPTGFLLLTTPNLAALGARASLALGMKPWMIEEDMREGYAGHIRYFTKSTLAKLLSRNGFVIRRCLSPEVKLGPVRSRLFGEAFPSLGTHLVVQATKTQ